MRRVKFLAIAVAIAALTTFAAAPVMADDWDDWGGWRHGWVGVDRITDADWDNGRWEFEGEGTVGGRPADLEWVCDWWTGDCWLTDVDWR